MSKCDEPSPRGESGTRPASEHVTDRAANTSILVVEDDVDAAWALQTLLRLEGYDAASVYTGTDALSYASANRIDVVLCDLGLPDMSGYEVARQMRESGVGNEVALIAVTGHDRAGEAERCEGAGFDAHVVKPLAIDALCNLLDEIAQ